MDLAHPTAHFGLSAIGIGTRTGVTWRPVLGEEAQAMRLPLVDIAYQIRAVSGSAADEVQINLSAGSVSIATLGGLLVSGQIGQDFEKTALPAAALVHGVLVEVVTLSGSGHNVVLSGVLAGEVESGSSTVFQRLSAAGWDAALAPMGMVFGGVGDTVTVTVFASAA